MTTIGVEEEFLLLDPCTGENVPVAGRVLGSLTGTARERSRREFRQSMVEMATPVSTGLAELRRHLIAQRGAAATAARAGGANLVAIAATPVAEPDRAPADDARFHAIGGHYGPIAFDPAVCGCHVHIGVPGPDLAVDVCTRLRPWLPVVQAVAANSPLFEGADTGFASWRSAQLLRWPSRPGRWSRSCWPIPARPPARPCSRT